MAKTTTSTKASTGASGSASKSTTSPKGKKAPKQTAVPLRRRDPKVLAGQATYATAAIVDDALGFAQQMPQHLSRLRSNAPRSVTDLRGQLDTSVQDLRSIAARQFDSRVAPFESSFDKRVKAGKKVTDKVRKDQRVARAEKQLTRVWEQTDNTRSQVKAAVTSVRKTADVALEAGRKQAGTAKSQVKAAVTSARKTVGTVASAGREVTE